MKRFSERIKEIRKKIPNWTILDEYEFLKEEMADFNLEELSPYDLPDVFSPSDVVDAYDTDDLLNRIDIDTVIDYYRDDLADKMEEEVIRNLECQGYEVVYKSNVRGCEIPEYEIIKAMCNRIERGCKNAEDMKRIVCAVIDDGWDGRYVK